MSGETAGFIVETVRRKNIIDKGQPVNEEEMAQFRQMMRDRYDCRRSSVLHRVAAVP